MAQTASEELLDQTKLALAAERRCGRNTSYPLVVPLQTLRRCWFLSQDRQTHNLTMNRFLFLFLFLFLFRFCAQCPRGDTGAADHRGGNKLTK